MSPGPADYQHIVPQTKQQKPLTSALTFSNSSQNFTRQSKDTMKVNVYSREYERDYSNRIGPGPAAYSSINVGVKTDRFK